MRGILLIEPLYHQVIRGNKTQTRRSGGLNEVNHKPDYWWLYHQIEGNALFRFNPQKQRNPNHKMDIFCKARYKVGEVLYVKEPTREMFMDGANKNIVYKYDMTEAVRNEWKWDNKLFMPADKARAFIRITGIRCERLMDISDEDCIAEGIAGVYIYKGVQSPMKKIGYRDYSIKDHAAPVGLSEKSSFISLYKFANKVKEVPNLWCWVYDFEYLKDYKN